MYEILMQISQEISATIYTRADAAIAAMCRFSWAWLMGPLIGLVLGYHVILNLLDDKASIVDGLKKMLIYIIPLLIAAAIIRPGGDGCYAVTIKKEILSARASITDLIAPGYGTSPDALIVKSTSSIAEIMQEFVKQVSSSTMIKDPKYDK